MKTTWVIIIILIIIVLVAGYWWFSMSSAVQPTTNVGLNNSPGQTNTGQTSVTPVLTVNNDANLGDHLVASNGMTLYEFATDKNGKSSCTGTCATNWPPYLWETTNEPLVVGSGVSGQLSTTTRSDGTIQLTYKGKPLYFYMNDTNPGDVTGQGVSSAWSIAKP